MGRDVAGGLEIFFSLRKWYTENCSKVGDSEFWRSVTKLI